MDRPAAARRRAAAHHPVLADGATGRRRRRAGAGLLRPLLPPRLGGPVPVRGRAGRLRRGDARPGRRRRPAAALRVLGADHGLLLPADRAQHRAAVQPLGGRPGAHRDHPGWAGHAGRLPPARPARRRLPLVGDRRRAAARRSVPHRGGAADPGRGAGQVRRRAVQLLAARGDGRADAGQRIPARGGDGEGRGLPARAARPGARRRRPVAAGHRGRRAGHPRRRGLGGAAADRPEAAAGVRDGQPARPADRGDRRRHPEGGAGRRRDAAGARAVQGGPVPRRRPPRPHRRHPRPAGAVRGGAHRAAAGGGRRARRRVDGRAAAAARLRREGGGPRRLHRAAARARRAGRRHRPHRRLQHPVPLGRLRQPSRHAAHRVGRHPGRDGGAPDRARRRRAGGRSGRRLAGRPAPPVRRASSARGRPTSRSGPGRTWRWGYPPSRSPLASRCTWSAARSPPRWPGSASRSAATRATSG